MNYELLVQKMVSINVDVDRIESLVQAFDHHGIEPTPAHVNELLMLHDIGVDMYRAAELFKASPWEFMEAHDTISAGVNSVDLITALSRGVDNAWVRKAKKWVDKNKEKISFADYLHLATYAR